MQTDLFAEKTTQLESIPLKDAEIKYNPHFLDFDYADEVYQQLRKSLVWRQEQIKIFGKNVKIPRMQAWYGDAESKYEYSGLLMDPLPWTPLLLELKQKVENVTGKQFNSVLANLYRDGNDGMGWHADNEKELGVKPTIASLSVGQVRDFDLRHSQSGEKLRISLKNGSLLVMSGETQSHWQHAVPKRNSQKHQFLTARINLTFRKIMV